MCMVLACFQQKRINSYVSFYPHDFRAIFFTVGGATAVAVVVVVVHEHETLAFVPI